MPDDDCDELRASADLLRGEAEAAMHEASQVREDQRAFLTQVSVAARCEAVAEQVEERLEEEC